MTDRLRDCPGFGRVWTAATVSGFGSYVTAVVLPVLVVDTLHGQAAEVGLVSAARWVPYLILGLVVGALVERSRRRPLLILTDLARAALLVAVPVLAVTGTLTLGALVATIAVFGTFSLVGDAASQSFLPRVVPARLLTAANARLDQGEAVAQTSGPALAGGLVTLLGAPAALLVDAASYLVSGLLLIRVPTVEPPPGRISLRGVGTDAAEGLAYVYRHPTLRPMALGTHGWFLCFAVVNAVLAPFVLGPLRLSPFAFGAAIAVAGGGGLLGSLLAVRLGRRWGAGRVVIACRAATAVAVAVTAASPPGGAGWLVLAAGQLLLGVSMGAENANEMGYRQAVTPDRLQSRMNTTMRSINRAMIVVGAPLGGLLADAVGYRTMLAVAAGGFLLGAAALAASRFRTAQLPG